MAAIDKTYIRTKDQYQEIYNWVMSLPVQKDDLGFEFDVKDWLPREYDDDLNEIGAATPDYIGKQIEKNREYINKRFKNEKYWNESRQYYPECKSYADWLEYVDKSFGEICLWNTPTWLDIFLIRNCPVELIQDRLKLQYRDEYDKILTKTCKYADIPDNTGHSFKLPRKIPRKMFCCDVFVLDADDQDLYLNTRAGRWVDAQHKMCKYDEFFFYTRTMSKRKLGRLIKKWHLQKGWTVELVIYPDKEKRTGMTFKIK